jgi:hypothetical protein
MEQVPSRDYYQTPRPAPLLRDLTAGAPGFIRFVIWERVLMTLAVGLVLVAERRAREKRVRDWEAEDACQVGRGAIDCYITPDLFDKPEKTGRRGRPREYSDELVWAAQLLRQLDQLSYRPLEGLLVSLARILHMTCKMPDHVTLWRRTGGLSLPELPRLTGERVITVDSSGVKVLGPGEWRRDKHAEHIERTYLKLHLVRDVQTGLILDWALTSSSGSGSNDGQVGTWMVRRLVCEGLRIAQALGDGAYDGASYRGAAWLGGGHAIVPPPHNAAVGSPEFIGPGAERTRQVLACRTPESREAWKNQSGYHQRSLSETTFSRHHAYFGERMSARDPRRQRVEMAARVWLLNEHLQRSIA